jgi:CDP-diacylglycerol---glycerol-3-phosphate 3-phosphatidyltransferase
MALRYQQTSSAETLEKKRMTLRDSRAAEWYLAFLSKSVLPLLKHTAVSPNQITILGFGLALLVPVGFYLDPLYGFLFILFSGVTDSLDGLLSRVQGNGSIFGAFLDSTLDRASDLFFLAGFWVLFLDRPYLPLATALFFSSVLFTFLISYTKARSEGLGSFCRVGFMGRAARIIFLLVWALLLILFVETRLMLLWGGLVLYTGLTLGTVIQRLVHIGRRLHAAGRGPAEN